MAKHININTKEGRAWECRFRYGEFRGYTDLEDVYTQYSYAKARAMDYCKTLAAKENALTPVYILSRNTFGFTVGWKAVDPETGVISIRIETPKSSYIVN